MSPVRDKIYLGIMIWLNKVKSGKNIVNLIDKFCRTDYFCDKFFMVLDLR